MTNVTTVAGVLEVELFLRGNISQEVVQDMFTRALAAAVEIPQEFVIKLTASEITQASGLQRRLQETGTNATSSQDNQTKVYEVAYEIIVPEYMDADEIIEKANRIAEPGSKESQMFRQVLLETEGVIGVGKIIAKVPAYKATEEITTATPSTPADEDDNEIWKPLLIGLSIAVVVVVCLVSSAVVIKRKVLASEAGNQLNANVKASGDVEAGWGNLVNDKVEADEPCAAPAPQMVKDNLAVDLDPAKGAALVETPRDVRAATEPVEDSAKKGLELTPETHPSTTDTKRVAQPPLDVKQEHNDRVKADVPLRSSIVQL